MLADLVLMAACGGSPVAAEVAVVTIAPVAPVASATSGAPDASASAAPVASASAAPKVDDSPEARAAKIARELEMLDSSAIGVLGASGPGVGLSGLSGGVVGGLRLGSGNGSLQPGQGGGLAGIGGTTGPVGHVLVLPPSLKGGNVANVASVVAGMSAGFRRCYNRGLQADPSLKGSLTLEATLGVNGEVLSVRTVTAKGVSASVVACSAARISSAQFAAPDGGSATVSVSIQLAPAP